NRFLASGMCEDSESLFVKFFRGLAMKFLLVIRRLAWGWPLAVSQEEHLSYCVGSPWALAS
ncbi:hypothetical protein SB775_30790, partial [Peribacillus sp. SIMBA_075]|uniref:hypothetical protein n=1 Tax=Peribacillus sp. SIMBA_075 TaxID=3085813 RepID=UPI00397A68A2